MSMGNLSYRIQVIIRLVLILFLGFAAVFLVTGTDYWMVAIWLGLIIMLLILAYNLKNAAYRLYVL